MATYLAGAFTCIPKICREWDMMVQHAGTIHLKYQDMEEEQRRMRVRVQELERENTSLLTRMQEQSSAHAAARECYGSFQTAKGGLVGETFVGGKGGRPGRVGAVEPQGVNLTADRDRLVGSGIPTVMETLWDSDDVLNHISAMVVCRSMLAGYLGFVGACWANFMNEC
ncbi:hypothetical protein L1987_46193 [Smallanthus sonchifolius]|uniref:Uncharacterized protein n=1 Tax=Smallanthus sonchifolius TaxID=185202 RepID=A0ACB9G0S7_9ASTR|nr:hypothetical protein L1987_46193 [Smallanthus sonchifolius]